MRKPKNTYPWHILAVFCFSVVFNGGFFDDTAAVTGLLICICLLVMLIRKQPVLTQDKRLVFRIPALLFVLSFLVSFWAIDYLDNMMGAMRLGVVCLWIWLLQSQTYDPRGQLKTAIPILGCVTALLSFLSRPFEAVAPRFWENSRMSGFFQYANTCALFFLICIILVRKRWKQYPRRLFALLQLACLLAGLVFTGSRSILLLALCWGIYEAVRVPGFRKPFAAVSLCLAAVGGGYFAVTGNTGNISRIFTLFSSNSTLWGRLLYARDAALLLCRKFYGLGRMGYYYSQGTFQSGVYTVRFVHNDFLQVALDYGVLALVLLLAFLFWQFFKGTQNPEDKEMLAVIALASLIDFHLQYLSIVFLAVLFLDLGTGGRASQRDLRENYVLFPVFAAVLLFIGIATGSSRLGDQELALAMLPDYTDAQEMLLRSTTDPEESYELASKIISKNQYDSTAFAVRGMIYASLLEPEAFMEDFDRLLELKPYRVEYYQQYMLLLNEMLVRLESAPNTDIEEGDPAVIEQAHLLQTRLETLPDQLAAVRNRTSSLAYKIKDKPVFEIPQQ